MTYISFMSSITSKQYCMVINNYNTYHIKFKYFSPPRIHAKNANTTKIVGRHLHVVR